MEILHRAQSIYSDEYFISSDIKFEHSLMYLRVNGKWRECDESTRSINFKNIIESNKNLMFAAVNPDGKGGDILKCYLGSNIEDCKYREKTFKYTSPFRFTIGVYDIDAYPIINVIGIQK